MTADFHLLAQWLRACRAQHSSPSRKAAPPAPPQVRPRLLSPRLAFSRCTLIAAPTWMTPKGFSMICPTGTASLGTPSSTPISSSVNHIMPGSCSMPCPKRIPSRGTPSSLVSYGPATCRTHGGYLRRCLSCPAMHYFMSMYVVGKSGRPFTCLKRSLIERCFALGSLRAAQSIHGSLIKTGLHRHTFLGNCLLDLYSGLSAVASALGVFHNIPDKNTFSWNILLMVYLRGGQVEATHQLFDEMPDRDVVSWNSLISGYASGGFADTALEILARMQELGVKASVFTLFMTASCVSSARQAKEVHGSVVRFKLGSSSVVLGNSLFDMYGRVGLMSYATRVFGAMDDPDVISWNSVLSAYGRSGYITEAPECFCAMRTAGFSADEFTLSSVLNLCADLRDMAKGEQLLAHCFKMRFLSNSVVSSAVVDMELQNGGMKPDKTTLVGILLACRSGGMIHEGRRIFSLMERKYRVMKDLEHYACMVDMMGQAGRLKEAMDNIQTSPHFSKPSLWSLLLEACRIHGDLSLAEIIAEKLTKLEVRSSLPYLILARMYGVRCKWESMVRVQKTMEERGVKKTRGYSWICI
ncbi:hypothetical protein Cni_G12317 [Canna indica]|uniref:Pentatricopeptide repeat-containing protein n=1 Tax=Canna indica TaxID=4628 RepID=A0AAQ3K7Y3_9LILI|nr:hypothetical protein Cni_G12317 [Canna indica]